MTDLRKAAEMALEDICGAKVCEVNSMSSRAEMLRLMDKAAEALLQALAQSEQEPVAWRNAALRLGEDLYSVGPDGYYDMTASQWLDWALSVVNTAPPKREWVGLTDEERQEIVKKEVYWSGIARAIEDKLKEKNT